MLPSGNTAVASAGLHEMPRGTANHLLNAIVHQLRGRDGVTDEDLQRAFNDFSADTCNTTFGRSMGPATRLAEIFANLTARKCGNHKGALAASHGCNAVSCLKSVFLPVLERMGVQIGRVEQEGDFRGRRQLSAWYSTEYTRWWNLAWS